MKTIKFIPLIIIIITFTSCNTAKNYANYRVGGKSPKKDILGNSLIKKNNHDKNRMATLEMMPVHDTLEIKNNKATVLEAVKSAPNKKEKFVTNNIIRGKIQNMVVGMRNNANGNKINNGSRIKSSSNENPSNKNINDAAISSSKKTKNAFQKYGTDTEDVLYFLFGALLIAGGILALLAAGVTVAEIVIFGLGLIGVLILLYLLGEAFMNIFPGMSRKNKKFIAKKKHALKQHSSFNKSNFNRNLSTTIIITSLVVGVIAFAISDSVVAAIIIAVLVALGMALIVALAFCLAIFFIFWIIFAAFGLI